MYTQEQYQVCKQPIQQKYIKLQILNWNEDVVDEIKGKSVNGNINIDATQTVRRTLDLTMILDDKLVPSPNSPIWLNKKIKVFIGIRSISTNEIVWFNKGVYIMFKPTLRYSHTDNTLSIQALDKMCWLDGQLSGKLEYITKINGNLPKIKEYTTLFEAVKSTVVQLGGESKVLIDDLKDNNGKDLLVPYTIEKSASNTVAEMLVDLRNLYMYYEFYYDEDGRFHFEKIKNRKNDIIMHNFNENNINLSFSNEPKWDNVKNDIMIWGATLKDGTQIKYHIEDNNLNNQFSINKIGRRKWSPSKTDKITTLEQAKIRAEYELFKHSNLAETVTLTVVPDYTVDVNQKIKIDDKKVGIYGEYLIDKVSFGLDINSTMNITAHKLYYES
ncbi:DUF5048 domain-containing protein [Clostridium botulinum C]|uniref:DUF5048 domain-containing protein n=1 Tax=Clostridium botulinum C TaxID=36828 RepID=A0A9Q3V9G5_CLOBO|nr:hypothetical protein [Clostridium botulinum]MCD3194820.1 DUF5048 domain-containing protein [Clostridium botulinum C]MCD3200245.1 DUF5048 domain-containing protein [Clostridium botulinum C]MCD3205688.1 DUF5048 domain-containing protein [Clostridium botulinum C]MCD3207477.1 DUF5048 domain-containing protein [Clostridium botulinum C]MCD3226211.1 DUF5048 domain-containing protein [Clostridium botulinum C]